MTPCAHKIGSGQASDAVDEGWIDWTLGITVDPSEEERPKTKILPPPQEAEYSHNQGCLSFAKNQ